MVILVVPKKIKNALLRLKIRALEKMNSRLKSFFEIPVGVAPA